jgi:flagellar FliL protein
VALLKNKLVLIIIVVLILGGGGAYYFLFMGKKAVADGKKKGHTAHNVASAEEDHDDEAQASEEHESKGEDDEDAAEHEEGEDEEEGHSSSGHGGEHGESKGPVMEPFVVNLADPGSRRYLRVNLKVALKKPEENGGLLTERMPQVRDSILLLLSSKTADQLSSPEGKTTLRKELIEQLNTVLKKGKKKKTNKVVANLYFTEFLIQ